MAEISEQDLKAHLASGTLAPLYLLFGEEKLTLRRAARRLIEKASDDPFPQFNRAMFTGESDVENISDALSALPFMAEHKCVAVSDFDPDARSADDLERLCSLFDDLPDTATLVFWYPTLEVPIKKPSSKWKKLLDRAGRAGCTLDFPRLTESELQRLLKKDAQRQGCELLPKSCRKLLDCAGSDLRTLKNELEKLCAYALGLGETEITPQMVEDLTPKSTETTVFVMVRALTSGRGDEAYRQLDLLFYQGEEPVAVLGAMTASYIDMYRVKAALESGLTSSAPAEYVPEYKGRGSFRLQNAQRSLRSMSLTQLRNCLDLLLDADMSLKGSRLDPRLVLEGLISRLLLAAQS